MATQYTPKQNVVLTGFMGCGKTTIGTRLAFLTKLECLDTDKLIEKREKKSISDIFAQDGEAAFRQMETDLLKNLVTKNGVRIYSVGGGTPVREENRELLRSLGIVVYLKVSPETVYERLKGDTTRPLLNCEDPLSRIKELLDSRREAYEESAHLIVEVDGKDADQIIEEMIMGIRRLN